MRFGTILMEGATRSNGVLTTKPVPTLDEVQSLDGERIDTGIDGLNRVFGTNRNDSRQGLAIPSSVIFSGSEGSGKSTLILTMLAKTPERKTLLISTEQTLSEIKATLIGIQLGHRASRIQAYSLLDEECSMEVAWEKIKAVNPRILILDSISKMREFGQRTKDHNASRIRIVEAFKRDAELNQRATIMIAHMTKEEQVAGARANLHDVSTILMLTKQDKTLRRLHSPGKNRFGDTSEEAFFRMERTGMLEVFPDQNMEEINEKRVTFGLKPRARRGA